MAQPLAFQIPDAAAEQPAEDRDATRRLADFDRAKFASEVAGHVMRPDDEAFHRDLVARGIPSEEIIAALKKRFAHR
ncbi:MAG: hypothetical protein RIB84_27750 [Sneathiellaceae bacterium]